MAARMDRWHIEVYEDRQIIRTDRVRCSEREAIAKFVAMTAVYPNDRVYLIRVVRTAYDQYDDIVRDSAFEGVTV